jgi:hypothetical protein
MVPVGRTITALPADPEALKLDTLLPGRLLVGDSGTMTVAGRRPWLALLLLVTLADTPTGVAATLLAVVLLALVLGLGLTVVGLAVLLASPLFAAAVAALLGEEAEAAEKPALPPAARAVRAARSAAAAASLALLAELLNIASPTSSQRMVRAAARDATAWPMLMGRRRASARSAGARVCRGKVGWQTADGGQTNRRRA